MKPNLFLSFLILSVFVGTVLGGTYRGGDGSQENPYKICDANSMNEIGANPTDWGSHFLLVSDINLAQFTGVEFNTIGTNSSNAFTGVFDGNNHTISNFTYNSTGCFVSLFGYVKGADAEIKNLGLIDPNVIFAAGGTGFPVGSLVGYLERGAVSACYAEGGSVCSSEENVGGLVGWSDGTVSDCYATCSVFSTGSDIGGLVGDNGEYSGSILKCYATGSVEGNDRVGGLVGDNSIYAKVLDCYATGPVYGNDRVGGLVGWNESYSLISNSYATGLALGNSNVGGLVGDNVGTVSDSFWDLERSKQPTSDGGTGKTTRKMKQKGTFTNWDFVESWGIEDNQTYPFLKLTYPVGDIDIDGDVEFMDFAYFSEHWLEGVE